MDFATLKRGREMKIVFQSSTLVLAASLAFGAAEVSAQQATAPVVLGFTVFDQCEVSGQSIFLGSYTDGDTLQRVMDVNGKLTTGGDVTAGTAPVTELGSVNCPASTVWTAFVRTGNSVPGGGSLPLMPIGNVTGEQDIEFGAGVVAYEVDGVALPLPILLSGLGSSNGTITREGTGSTQAVRGRLPIFGSPNLVLRRGVFRGAITFVVDFVPIP